jgi:hypothetical protein
MVCKHPDNSVGQVALARLLYAIRIELWSSRSSNAPTSLIGALGFRPPAHMGGASGALGQSRNFDKFWLLFLARPTRRLVRLPYLVVKSIDKS